MKSSYKNVALGGMLLAGALLLGGCERPPVHTTQVGYRGVAMETVTNPRTAAVIAAKQTLPEVIPAAPAVGPAAGTIYQNVKVLGDLNVAEFARVMLAMTAWVAPKDQACNYCHAENDLASDAKYTKVVARRMLEMVRDINQHYQPHVAATGVTCYTCHRGQPVPAQIWFKDTGPKVASSMTGNRAGQNYPAPSVALTSLPLDPFSAYLTGPSQIRVIAKAALPTSKGGATIQQTETTYGLMAHMSQALGVNCTYCHNSRSFAEWSASTPARVKAWHGIGMVQKLNAGYLEPLTSTFPKGRLGPHGDAPKVNCATCHQGVFKPLAGQSMLKDYPELAGPKPAPVADAPAADAPAPAAK